MPRPAAARDYELALESRKLLEYGWTGTREDAAMTGLAVTSVRQPKVALRPAAYSGRRQSSRARRKEPAAAQRDIPEFGNRSGQSKYEMTARDFSGGFYIGIARDFGSARASGLVFILESYL